MERRREAAEELENKIIRIRVGPTTQEGQRLTQIKQSYLRKLQSCISELNTSGFNDWLLHQQPA